MVVTEFTYEQAKKLIDTPKVILESDGKTVCKQKQILGLIMSQMTPYTIILL